MGPPARLAGRALDARRGRDAARLADGGRGRLLAVLVPAFWLAAALAALSTDRPDPAARRRAGRDATEGATTLAAMGYPVLSLVLKIVVVACGLAALLELFDFDVGTVLAGLGIGGLAFALAAQDTLKNFFGSLMLIADRTFRVGDLVKIGGNEGVVESVGPPHHADPRARRLAADDPQLRPDHLARHQLRRPPLPPLPDPDHRGPRHAPGPPDPVPRRHPGADPGPRPGPPGEVRGRRERPGQLGNRDPDPGLLRGADGHAELIARDGLILEILRLAERLGICVRVSDLAAGS